MTYFTFSLIDFRRAYFSLGNGCWQRFSNQAKLPKDECKKPDGYFLTHFHSFDSTKLRRLCSNSGQIIRIRIHNKTSPPLHRSSLSPLKLKKKNTPTERFMWFSLLNAGLHALCILLLTLAQLLVQLAVGWCPSSRFSLMLEDSSHSFLRLDLKLMVCVVTRP